jgi:predicted nucleotidyltransferase
MNPIKILLEHLDELRDEYYVSRIGIFGSFARGEARPDSDVDILVEFSQPVGLFHFVDLQDRLTQILGRKADLGQPGAIKPVIKEEVLKETIWLL